jgi:hypothetical protein
MAVKECSYWMADAYAALALTRSLLGITLPELVGKEASKPSAFQNILSRCKILHNCYESTATSQHSVHHDLPEDAAAQVEVHSDDIARHWAVPRFDSDMTFRAWFP